MTTPRARFAQHRCSTRPRNIRFELTFEEWWEIWQRSGKWKKRGCRRGQYVMARFGDKGPYAVGNVHIIRQEDNHRESRPNQRYTDAGRLALVARSRGSRNGNATLNEDQVGEIRAAYAASDKRRGIFTKLATTFNVSVGQISSIVKHKCWRHTGELNKDSIVTIL